MDAELKLTLDVLSRHGVMVVSREAPRYLAVSSVAQLLDVKPKWVKEHLEEFPHWFRLPGGGRNGGEIRIPERDVTAFQTRGLARARANDAEAKG